MVALVMKAVHEDMAVTPPLAIEKIGRIHRVGKQDGGRHRHILIKFATYRSRRRVISRRKFLNPLNRTERRQTFGAMLPAGAAGAWQQPPAEPATTGRPYKMFMNDDLTRARAQLLYRCRMQKKDNKIADCWSTDGTILSKLWITASPLSSRKPTWQLLACAPSTETTTTCSYNIINIHNPM